MKINGRYTINWMKEREVIKEALESRKRWINIYENHCVRVKDREFERENVSIRVGYLLDIIEWEENKPWI